MSICSPFLIPGVGDWDDYAAVVAQSVVVNTNPDTSRMRFVVIGNTVLGDVEAIVTSTGTAAASVTVSLPTPMASLNNNTVLGTGFIATAAGAIWFGDVVRISATAISLLRRVDGSSAQYLGSSGLNAALTAGAIVSFNFQYEAA